METEENVVKQNSGLRDQLRRQTGTANVSLTAAAAASGDSRGAITPRVGNLYVLPQTAEWSVEWAILDLDPPRVLAIPADTSSLVGSSDVAVPASASRGALSLRCGFGAWVKAAVFEQATATGLLDSKIVQAAKEHWAALDRGEVCGSLEEREVDLDSEYLEWVEDTLTGARAALVAASTAIEPVSRPTPESELADVVPIRPPRPARRWSTFGGPMGLAASVLLVISLGLGRQLMLSEQAQEAAVQEHRQQITELEQDQQQAHESHQQDLARMQSALGRATEEHQQQLAELEASQRELGASRRPQPVVNLPFVVLSSGPTRSGGERLKLPSDSELFMLILRLAPSDTYPKYRLEVRRRGTERVLWSSSQLSTRGAELTVALPRTLLPAGEYELRLSGLSAGGRGSANAGEQRGTELGLYALTLEAD